MSLYDGEIGKTNGDKYISAILHDNNPAAAVRAIKQFLLDDNTLRTLHDIVLEFGGASHLYFGILNTPEEKRDVARFQDALLAAAGNVSAVVEFAQNIKGADKTKLGSFVARSGSLKDIEAFLEIADIPPSVSEELRAARDVILDQQHQRGGRGDDDVCTR